MDSKLSQLPTSSFQIIRDYVGPRYPIIKRSLQSHIYKRIKVIEHMDIRLEIDGFYPLSHLSHIRCFWSQFQFDIRYKKNNKQRLQRIVALGSFRYKRDWFEYNYERGFCIPHEMIFTTEFRPFWTLRDVLEKIRFWEYVVRTELMNRFDNGHIYLERLLITNDNTISSTWGS